MMMNLIDQIFNDRAALLAFFGALGGAVRSAVLRTTWREGLRVIFIGAATAFAVGALGPFVLKPWIGEVPADMAGSLGTLCSAAFIIGLVSVTMIERWIEGDKNGSSREDEPQP
jgi:drug/metabolite transporter (DMT)-like permease